MEPRVGKEKLRTEREEGFELLFGAAQDVARRERKLADGVQASLQHSQLERGLFKLRSRRNQLIAAIPVQQVRVNDANPAHLERKKVRVQPVEVRALAWAISKGRRVPSCRRQRWAPLMAVSLLLCGVLPGLAYLAWLWQRRRRYRTELKALVKRWRQAGQPEPSASFFRLYGH